MRLLSRIAVVLVAVWLTLCGFLFVWPGEDSPERADAVVVLAGGKKARLAKGLELVRRGVSRTLVISDGRDPKWAAANRLCDGAREDLTVVCFRPSPYSTRGEAEDVAELARRRGWRSVAVVTSRYHVYRARLLFERCFSGRVDLVGSPYKRLYLPMALFFETGKLGVALTVRREC